jgi:hypothetical protein
MASDPSGSIKIDAVQLIDDRVYTLDDVGIGTIYAVNKDFIVVKNGIINSHFYYIPVDNIQKWNNGKLWLKTTKQDVKKDYEKDSAPDPSAYYMKENPRHPETYFPSFVVIPPKTSPQAHEGERDKHKLECDLCHASFRTQSELTFHIDKMH